jgi:hypothetical protein
MNGINGLNGENVFFVHDWSTTDCKPAALACTDCTAIKAASVGQKASQRAVRFFPYKALFVTTVQYRERFFY